MDASGALDSLLGRLTTILVNEAQLLGGVRSDVEFIKDEMESMNGLILYLTEAQHRDHQVRAWMKQVVGLTQDCEGNVELYVHYVGSRPGDDGLLGHLRRIMRFLRTIPVRHSVATRIKELKVRAQDVGDRRQRYGVTVPASTSRDMDAVDIEPSAGEEDLRRRAVLLEVADEPPTDNEVARSAIDTLINCLSTESATIEDGAPLPQVKFFSILGSLGDHVAGKVYEHSSVATLFDFKAWSNYWNSGWVLAKILEGVQLQPGQEEGQVTNQATETTVDDDREKRLICNIHKHLQGKRFLIVVTSGYGYIGDCKLLLDDLLQAADGSLPGSAIIITTKEASVAMSFSACKVINAQNTYRNNDFFNSKAIDLGASAEHFDSYRLYKSAEHAEYLGFFELFNSKPDTFAMKTFMHLLYVNPSRTKDELQNYKKAILECERLKRSFSKQVLRWCYNELPSKYRSCLLYLTVFPEGHVIRATSLARRWVAEGLITAATNSPTDGEIHRSSTDEAEHCLDVLFTRGFVSPVEIYAADNIKSYTVHRQVREFIARVASDVNFVDSSLPPYLARYLSIHNRIGLQKSHSDGESKDIAAYLPSLAASPQWKLLKVLDLEGCKDLNKKHIKSICKILLLKYLSLRNTDVTELPKQIKELQCLETLDIRQTKVQMLAKKAIVLPLLKHFLAGHKVSNNNGTRTSGELVSAVELPHSIHKMKNMEILSHIKVTNDNELTAITELLKLRKLGVVLNAKSTKLSDLFCKIEKLGRCLRALSIRIDPLAGTEDVLPSLPQFIERLNISGISNGISSLVREHHQLTKITLSGTNFKDDDLRLLGRLHELSFLRLQHNSYPESGLVIMSHEFQNLKYLLVKGSGITRIKFAYEAAPKLERIVLSFDKMGGLSGTEYLGKLKVVELNGDRILMKHPNHQEVK